MGFNAAPGTTVPSAAVLPKTKVTVGDLWGMHVNLHGELMHEDFSIISKEVACRKGKRGIESFHDPRRGHLQSQQKVTV